MPENASNGSILRAVKLSRTSGGKNVVLDVSFDVLTGSLLGVVGASGAGKSSLLRLLNRLDEPTNGTVYLDGTDYKLISPRDLRRRVGMVTQRPFFFPGDVGSNLRFGPAQRGVIISNEEIGRLLERVGLCGFAANNVSTLSGGEQQRVSLARTLANQPEVLLLDEPTSALDEESKLGIEELIRDQVQRHGLTCVMVTHDREQARRLFSHILLMEAGRVTKSGTTTEVFGA